MENIISSFSVLNRIDCSKHVEKKQGLSYLSWAWAWQIVKENFPDAYYTIYEAEGGIPYFTDGRTAWVKTGVTIQGLEHIEYLPIMDYRNSAIPLEKITSWDMNKSIQRSLTKACARHGLGLYIYAGEDLPEASVAETPASTPVQQRRKAASRETSAPAYKPMEESQYWKVIECYTLGIPTKSGDDYRSAWIKSTNAGAAEVQKFDNDVQNFVAARNQ